MYVSTYRNMHGEDSVFIQHQCQPWPLFISGDDLVPEPAELHEAPAVSAELTRQLATISTGTPQPVMLAGDTVLEQGEYYWLLACWHASEWLRESYRTASASETEDS